MPALRLRGINLAIVTLGFASAFDAILAATTFPGQTQFLQAPRPDVFDSDAGYFLFVLIVFAALTRGRQVIAGSRLGASWLAIRHSERATAAHGVGIPSAKLAAFAISAFVAGIAGGLLAGYLGTLVADNFTMFGSLTLFAVATMTGAENAEGGVIGGLLVTLFPELLRRLCLPQDIGNVMFAVGAVQALSWGESASQAPRRLFGRFMRRRLREIAPLQRKHLAPARDDGEAAALTVRALTVRYGAVVALDIVSKTKAAGARVGILSNELELFYGRETIDNLDILKQMDCLIDATHTHILKPDPRAYALGVEAMGLPACEIVFVDDQARNIEGARKAGLAAVHFDVTRPGESFAEAELLLGLSD